MFSDISDRKASEDALRASATRSRTILESITDGFYALDADWRITYFNAAAERYLDRSSGDLIGKRLWDEFPGAAGSEFEQVYRRVASGQGSESITAHYPDFDRWYEVTAYPASGGLSVYFRDVTDSRRTQELLRASEQRQRLALDAAELGMWHVEPATRATKIDARFRAIFGTTEEWTDYLQVFAVIHPDDLSDVQEAVTAATRLADPIPYAIDYRIVYPDGSLHWVFAKGRSSIEGAGPTRRVTRFDGTVADITDRKRGAEERERLVARLREEDQRKVDFLATLAHELRNPLAPIRNGLQIMRLAQGDADATERVHSMMERQLGQMVHLIDDLMDLSRISRGTIDLRKERIELATAIQQAIEASRPSIAQADHELLMKLPPGPIHVDADLTRLTQVFSNLLSNSAKFTDRGGRIRLTVQQLGTDAVVSVQDNGIGIPTQILPRACQMFTQSAGPTPGRLEIRAGEIAVCGSRLVRIEAATIDGRVEVADLARGDHREVSLADLSSRQSGAIGVALDTQAEAGRVARDAVWQSATGREAGLTNLLNDSGPPAERAALTASQPKVCVRTVHRWFARFRDTSQTSALIVHLRGVRIGSRRLDGDRERTVTKIIEQEYLSQSPPLAEEIVRIVHQRCIEGKWKPVLQNAICARIPQRPRTFVKEKGYQDEYQDPP